MKNKIFIIVAFVLLLYTDSNAQSIIINNKELYIQSYTENAELLKKSLEENLASDLKEANEFKDRMEKIIATDLKEAYPFIDSIQNGLEPEGLRHYKRKEFFLQKEGKNIKIYTTLKKYEERNMSQDSLENFVRISLNPWDEKIGGYTKQTQNKTTSISFAYYNPYTGYTGYTGFNKKEIEKTPPVERKSEFYPNGKLKRTTEVKYKNYSRIVVVEDISQEVIIREEVIGIGYLYDNNGAIVEISEYNYDDSLFEFTKEDVMVYIKEEYIKDENQDDYLINIKKHPQYTVNGEIKRDVIWFIRISKRGDHRIRHIYLDGKTGKKLDEDLVRTEK